MDALQALILWGRQSRMKLSKFVLGLALPFAILLSSDATAEDEKAVFGDWTYAKKVDPLDESVTLQAYVIDPSKTRGLLFVQCVKAGNPVLSRLHVIYSQTGTFFGNGGLYPVSYRVDQNPMIEQEWSVVANGVFTTNASHVSSIVELMKAGASIIVEARDFRLSAHRNTFSLNGAGKAISAVEDGCNG